MMYIPKQDIYEKLQETGVTVLQGAQETYPETPAITYTISDNSTDLDLDNEIASQSIIVSVDIWTDTSMEASALLNACEKRAHYTISTVDSKRQDKETIWLEPEPWVQPLR